MNIRAIVCILMSCFFLALTVVFALLKEKGAILISGFNTLTKEQHEKYDKAKMSIDIRNLFFIMFLIFAVGALLSYLFSDYIAIAAFIIWLVLFFKNVHLDTEKAFGKYKQ